MRFLSSSDFPKAEKLTLAASCSAADAMEVTPVMRVRQPARFLDWGRATVLARPADIDRHIRQHGRSFERP
jgi:hypothetical protein